jgi:hypothetical protein
MKFNFLFLLAAIFYSLPAYAQADFSDGLVIIGTDSSSCTSANAGALRYNATGTTCNTNPTIYSTAGTYSYMAPGGCTSVTVEAWGGGGAGGTSDAGFGGSGGGGGGGYSRLNSYAVTAGNNYDVFVGAGGISGVSAAENSYFVNTSTLRAMPGTDGNCNCGGAGFGGIGGNLGAVGDFIRGGGNGAAGGASGPEPAQGGGGGGSAGDTGTGGNAGGATGGIAGTTNGAAGGDGAPGGGGGGQAGLAGNAPGAAGGGGSGASGNGGAGADGQVIITASGAGTSGAIEYCNGSAWTKF